MTLSTDYTDPSPEAKHALWLKHISYEPPATLEEWEAIPAVPGYRFIDGWWHDSSGGRSNAPPVAMTQRQVKILAGIIPVI